MNLDCSDYWKTKVEGGFGPINSAFTRSPFAGAGELTCLAYHGNPHDLRHTYATIMLMAHISPADVQRQLGHSSIAITVDRYCHWFPGEGRGDLERALRGRVRKSNGKSHIIAYSKEKGLQPL